MRDWSDDSWDFLSGDLDRDRRNLHLLMDTAEELYGVVDREERKRRAVDRAVLVTGAEKGFLLTPQDGALVPNVVRGPGGVELKRDTPYSRSRVQRVWETGKPILERGPKKIRPTDSIVFEHILSMMATRLLFEGRPVGVLYVHGSQESDDFTDADFRAFLALGGLIATALANARLADESAERAALNRHVERAREVQRRLQPDGVQTPPGFDVAGVGRVCQELSGDYYDVIQRPDGRIAIGIGDVCGKGIRAALYGATARALFRTRMAEAAAPEKTVDEMSRFLESDMDESEFMTFFVGILDPAECTLSWASAGHDPPFLRRSGGAIEELEGTGKPLGFMSEESHGLAGPVPFGSEDVLFLYTDGITEAMSAERELWGEERLAAALARHAGPGREAHSVLASILADVDAHRSTGPLVDDITCLVVRAL